MLSLQMFQGTWEGFYHSIRNAKNSVIKIKPFCPEAGKESKNRMDTECQLNCVHGVLEYR